MDVKMLPNFLRSRASGVGFVSGCSASSTGASSGPPTATSEEALKYIFPNNFSCSTYSVTSQIMASKQLTLFITFKIKPDRIEEFKEAQ